MTEIFMGPNATREQVDAAIECCGRLRDALVDGRYSLHYHPQDRAVTIGCRVPDVSTGVYISWCPFCGTRLPRNLHDVRYDVLDELGYDPIGSAHEDGEMPSESELLGQVPLGKTFLTDRWWRDRIEEDPRAFDITLPRLGSILAVPREGQTLSVLVLGLARTEPQGDERMLVVPKREGGWGQSAYAVSAWPYSTGTWTVVGEDRLAAARLARNRTWGTQFAEWPEEHGWRFLELDDAAGWDDRVRLAPIPIGTLTAGEFIRKAWGAGSSEN